MATYPDMEHLMLERLLLARTLGGDHDAFVVLGSMHWEQLYAVARDLSSSDEDALELTQGAFQQARNELSAIFSQAVISHLRVSIPCEGRHRTTARGYARI
jgi:hypothetical protein